MSRLVFNFLWNGLIGNLEAGSIYDERAELANTVS